MAKRRKKSTLAVDVAPSSEDYEARSGLEALVRAQEISGNKSLMRRIKSHAKQQNEAHARVLRLEGKLL